MKKNLLSLVVVCLLTCSCGTNAVINDAVDQVTNVVQADDKNVLMVKNGTNNNYPNITYGEAFDSFFSSPTWKYFKGTQEGPDDDGDGKPDYTKENVDVVEFTGLCTYMDVEVKALIQFVLNKEEGTFKASYLSFNEVPQSTLIQAALLAKAFESYSEKNNSAENETDPIQEEDKNILSLPEEIDSDNSAPVYEETTSYYNSTPQYRDDSPSYYEDEPKTDSYNYDALEYAGGYQGYSGYYISFSAYTSVSSDEIGVVEISSNGSYIGKYYVYTCESSSDWDLSQYDQTYIFYDESGGLNYLSFYEEDGVKMLDYNSQYRNTDILKMTEHYVS